MSDFVGICSKSLKCGRLKSGAGNVQSHRTKERLCTRGETSTRCVRHFSFEWAGCLCSAGTALNWLLPRHADGTKSIGAVAVFLSRHDEMKFSWRWLLAPDGCRGQNSIQPPRGDRQQKYKMHGTGPETGMSTTTAIRREHEPAVRRAREELLRRALSFDHAKELSHQRHKRIDPIDHIFLERRNSDAHRPALAVDPQCRGYSTHTKIAGSMSRFELGRRRRAKLHTAHPAAVPPRPFLQVPSWPRASLRATPSRLRHEKEIPPERRPPRPKRAIWRWIASLALATWMFANVP